MSKTATAKALEAKQKKERNENIDTALDLVKSRQNYETNVVVVPPVVVSVPTEAKEIPQKTDDNFIPGMISGIAISALLTVLIWAITMMAGVL